MLYMNHNIPLTTLIKMHHMKIGELLFKYNLKPPCALVLTSMNASVAIAADGFAVVSMKVVLNIIYDIVSDLSHTA